VARVRVLIPDETPPKVIERVEPPVQPAAPVSTPMPSVEQQPPAPPVVDQVIQAPYSAHPQGVHLSRRAIFFMIGLFIVITMVAVALARNVGHPQTLNGADTSTKSEAQQYFDKVNQVVELGTDELPTVANVSDADKVKKENVILSDVKNGDKMLFFAKSRKLVVFRPDTNKVVAVVSLTTQSSSQQPTTITPGNKTTN
jgi:hypothetical protein